MCLPSGLLSCEATFSKKPAYLLGQASCNEVSDYPLLVTCMSNHDDEAIITDIHIFIPAN